MSNDVRAAVRRMAETLPPDTTWDRVMYEVYVRMKLEEGAQAVCQRRTIEHDEVRREFGLDRGAK